MASGLYPHLAARWCRFLDVSPDPAKVVAAFAAWHAFEPEEAANAAGMAPAARGIAVGPFRRCGGRALRVR